MANYDGPTVDDIYNKMQNLQESYENRDNIEMNLSDMKEKFSELGENSPQDKVISNMFYESIKIFFDLGLQLVNNLNLELLFDEGKIQTKTD